MLKFFQDRFSAGLSSSTLKVYMAAIAVYHAPLGGDSLWRHPLVSRFLRGAMRLKPATCSRVTALDLSIVLDELSMAAFEPIESALETFLTFKMVSLLH